MAKLKSTTIPVSTYEYVLQYLAKAAKLIELDPNLLKIIEQPRKVTIVKLPIQMDDGSFQVFTGYRVQHSTIRGPGKGGIRYHPKVNLDEVSALAASMTSPSPHPPPMVPTCSPPGSISIFEPALRGVDPLVERIVARAQLRPDSAASTRAR